MSWTIRHRPEDGILWVTTEGVHTPEDVKRLALEIVAESKKLGVDKILVDDRKMTPNFRTLDIYKLPRNYLDWGAPAEMRVATVFASGSQKKEDFEFYETVAGNFGGVRVRVFEDSVDLAMAWLLLAER